MMNSMYAQGAQIITIFYLLIGSCMDVKDKTIKVWYIYVGILIAIIWEIGMVILEKADMREIMLGVLPGIMLLVLSKITNEKIGYGDGMFIIIIGVLLSISKVISILMIAFLLIGVISLILYGLKRVKLDTRVPFIPFLFIASTVLFFIQ